MIPSDNFSHRQATLQERINNACERYNRSREEVILMAVTKTRPAESVDEALESGLLHIGENRVQEASGKQENVTGNGFWELIGPLQGNKVRLALETFNRIQTVDRLKLVQRISRTCEDMEVSNYPILLQVNVGEDPAKHGCQAVEALSLVEAIQGTGNLRLDGLMTIGEFSNDETVVRKTFSGLRELRDQLSAQSGLPLSVLSMGMTGDLEWAIAEGSTLIRVGTALFGARN